MSETTELLDRIDDIMERCGHSHADRRITSPGFDERGGIGTSVWACPRCTPDIATIIDRLYGSHTVIPKRAPADVDGPPPRPVATDSTPIDGTTRNPVVECMAALDEFSAKLATLGGRLDFATIVCGGEGITATIEHVRPGLTSRAEVIRDVVELIDNATDENDPDDPDGEGLKGVHDETGELIDWADRHRQH